MWAFKTRSSSHVSNGLIAVCMVHKKKLTCGENGLSLFPRGLEPDKHNNCLLATSMCEIVILTSERVIESLISFQLMLWGESTCGRIN